MKPLKPKAKLTPPDHLRCQTEKRTGSFMTLGRIEDSATVRCENEPVWIGTEKEPDPRDNLRGSMSFCQEHREIFEEVCPDRATFKSIVRLAPIYGRDDHLALSLLCKKWEADAKKEHKRDPHGGLYQGYLAAAKELRLTLVKLLRETP